MPEDNPEAYLDNEGSNDEEEERDEDEAVEVSKSTLQKALDAMEKQSERMDQIEKTVQHLAKEEPPEEVDGEEADPDHDPTKEEEANEPSEKSNVRRAQEHTDEGDAFTKGQGQAPNTSDYFQRLEKRLASAIENKVEQAVEARTPTPQAGGRNVMKAGDGSIRDVVNRVIAKDREHVGLGENGFRKGSPGAYAKTEQFVQKSVLGGGDAL